MNPATRFGIAVKERRRQLGLSQEGLAAKAGLDRTYVSGVERGVRNPTLRIMQRIADALDIQLHHLVAAASGNTTKGGR